MKLFKAAIVSAWVGLVCSAFALDIGPNSAPPPLDVKTWIKGSPVKEFLPDKTYVVEFWATWCGPCKESIPHLTELAKKYAGKATFTGVSVYEKNAPVGEFANYGDKVAAFVKD